MSTQNQAITSIHANLDNSIKHLWFNANPHTEITVIDNSIIIHERYGQPAFGVKTSGIEIVSRVKKIHNEYQMNTEKIKSHRYCKGVLYDPVISSLHSNVDVYYYSEAKIESLMNLINKKCKKDVVTNDYLSDFSYLKLNFYNGTFLIAPYKNIKSLNDDNPFPATQSLRVQSTYHDLELILDDDYDVEVVNFLLTQLYVDYSERNNESDIYFHWRFL